MVTLYFNPHSIYNQCVTKEDATAGLLAPSRGHSAQYRRIRTGCSGQWSWRSRRVLMEDPNYPQDAGSETENTERVSDISSRVNKHTTAANIRTDSRSALWSEHDTQWTRWLGLCFSCNPMMHCGPKTPTWWKKFWNFHTSHLRSARAAPGGRLMKTSDQLMIICGARSLLTLSHCSRSTLYSGINYSHTLVREEWKEEISHKSLNITESLNHINEDSWSINVLMKFLTSDVSVQLPQSCSNRRQCEWNNDT